ncbi:MAG: Holliday junction branch migration protein RuvA [Clostridia bacterium]|nr:Holliday junction branch migration protein RuvA [Clostridia bacterium]
MIAYLRGKILSMDAESAVILSGDVGYEVYLSGSAAQSLSGKNEGEVYTYMSVREDDVSLYGFSSVEEKQLFLKLISVQGVGPRLAIGILSQTDFKKVVLAIAQSDAKALTNVKGLGKKTADRIILELKDKVGLAYAGEGEGGESVVAATGYEDAVVALMSLGYSRAESSRAVDAAIRSGAVTIEDILMHCMRNM